MFDVSEKSFGWARAIPVGIASLVALTADRYLATRNSRRLAAAAAGAIVFLVLLGVLYASKPAGFEGLTLAQGTLVWSIVAGVASLTALGIVLHLVTRIADRQYIDEFGSLTRHLRETARHFQETDFPAVSRQLLEQSVLEAAEIRTSARYQAEEEARHLIAEAREAAEAMRSQAERKAEATLSRIQQEAEVAGRQLHNDAQREAEEVRARAQQRADEIGREVQLKADDFVGRSQSQADETLSAAERRAQAMLAKAEQQAREADEREAETKAVLDAARERALIHQERAEQFARQLLASARESVLNEARGAYSKLDSTLQGMLGAAQGIEADLGRRLGVSPEGEELTPEAFDQATIDSFGLDGLEPLPSVEDLEEEAKVSAGESQEAASGAGAEMLGVAEDRVAAVGPERQEDGRREELSEVEAPSTYFGEVELGISPSAEKVQIMEFHNLLQKMDGVRVLSTAGSWGHGTVITVALDSPLPLRDLLAQMPNTKAIPSSADKPAAWRDLVGRMRQKAQENQRLDITFDAAGVAGKSQHGSESGDH